MTNAIVRNESSPALDAEAVTVGTPFSRTARGLYIGGGGTATLVLPDAGEVAFVGLLAGTILPVRCTSVKDGATATNIVALF